MEYIIIISLLIFLILLIFIKQIVYAKKIYTLINQKSDIKCYIEDRYIIFDYNPLNLWLIQNLYKSLKSLKKYDLKSYISFSRLDINPRDKFCLDWYTLISGTINLYYDSLLHISKRYKRKYFSILKSINTIYLFLFIKNIIYRNNINIKINKINSNVNTTIKKNINKNISKLKIVYDIVYLKEILNIINKKSPFVKLKNYYITNKKNKDKIPNKILYDAGKFIINKKSNNYNSIINNRINVIYTTTDKSILEEFYSNLIKL